MVDKTTRCSTGLIIYRWKTEMRWKNNDAFMETLKNRPGPGNIHSRMGKFNFMLKLYVLYIASIHKHLPFGERARSEI